MNSTITNWFSKPRNIEWNIYLGIDAITPRLTDQLSVTLPYMDDQGDKWGESHIKVLGQHYDDYSFWSLRQYFKPIGGYTNLPDFSPINFSKRQYKSAAPGVTGAIGEVLTTIFLQKVMRLTPFEFIHLQTNNSIKTPDMCLAINPTTLLNLFMGFGSDLQRSNNIDIIDYLSRINWDEPFPVECKSRRKNGDRQLRSALQQLISYWTNVPSMAGFGIYAQTDVTRITKLNLYLFMPKENEQSNIQDIILNRSDSLPNLSDNPKVSEIKNLIGGRLYE